ncbi:hypothetical protein LJC31_02400 [Synergistaceae bacterium OttesenSCG-928-I11]|nr:hypothetical protein [Synergistaceae bacterium OttesenSCG-928-I11]
MPVLKRRTIAVAAAFFLLMLVAGFLFLSSSTFYADLVAGKVGDAFQDMGGYDLMIGDLRGNPITGVDATGVRIVHDGVELASADSVEMRLDLASVLSSPKLSRLSLSGLTADLDTVLNHLPKKKKDSSGPPALERLTLHDSKITSPFGVVEVRDLTVLLSEGRYRVDLRGEFFSKPFSLKADIPASDGAMSLRQFAAEWNDMALEATGALSPSLDLSCSAVNLDMDSLVEVLPQLKSTTAQGFYSVEARLRNDAGLTATGEIRSGAGQIWRVPFDDLRTDFDYAENEIVLRDLNARLFGGAASGDAKIAFSAKSTPTLDLDFVASRVNTGDMLDIFPWLEHFAGSVDASCDISGPIDALGGTIRLDAKNVAVYGVNASNASLNARLSKSAAFALSFRASAMGAAIQGAGDIALKPNVRLKLDVDASGISLETLAERFPQIAEAGVDGLGTANVKISGPANALTFDARVSFPSMTAMREYDLKDVAAAFSYGKSGLALTEAKATFNDATLTAVGSSTANLLEGRENLDFNGSLSNLKLENFSNLIPAIGENHLHGTVSGKWSLGGAVADPHVRVSLSAPSLSLLKQVALSNVAAEAAYRDGALEVAAASAKMGSASLSAAGEIVLPMKDKTLAYNIKGSFDDLNPEDFVKMGFVSADLSGDLAGDFRVWSEHGETPSVRVFFKDSHVVYSKIFDVSNLRGSLTLRDGNLHLDRLRTVINTGYISVTGTVGNIVDKEFALEKIPLDLDVSIASADIGRISRLFMPDSKGYQGVLTGSADIKGSAADPRFRGDASLSGVRAFGLFLPIVRINDVSGSLNEIQFPRVRAIVGRGVINGHGSLRKTTDWSASVEASGRSVDIRSLTFSLDRGVRRGIEGTLDFDFKGDGWLHSFEGGGEVRVPTFSAMGIHITDFSAPFWVNEGYVLIEDSSAKGYGGILKAQVAKDLMLSNWGGRVEILSADFASVLKDLMPNAEGTISGSADLTLRIEGDSTRTSMQDGSGTFVIHNGEISGFPGTEAVSSIIGGRPLRFSSAAFPFSIDGKTLYLLPGTRVSAPSDDPVFKYIMADGSIVIEEKKISLSCLGNVNVRALNSFIGGLQSLVSAVMDNKGNTDALLQNFLGGALSGFSRNEFRDVSLIVKGTPDDLNFEGIEISQPMTFDTKPEALNQATSGRETEEERFRLKVEIPVGPGGGHGSNVGGQVGGQVFEQAIKSLFSF